MKKIDLAKQIKNFMYDQSLLDEDNESLYVITSSYLKSIIYKVYSDNSKSEPYSIIAGDFNKLNDLNKKFGFAEGDRCIKEAH